MVVSSTTTKNIQETYLLSLTRICDIRSTGPSSFGSNVLFGNVLCISTRLSKLDASLLDAAIGRTERIPAAPSLLVGAYALDP